MAHLPLCPVRAKIREAWTIESAAAPKKNKSDAVA
jgi:hypothetical protein